MTAITRTDGQSPNAAGARLVHMRSLGGHRREYQDLFSALFDLAPSTGRVQLANLRHLLLARALLFGTLDDDYAGFFLIALLRAALGRRTVGIFLRPQTCFQSSALRFRIKKAVFAHLRKVRPVSVFTIMPFSVAPQLAEVADRGLLDPHLWDMAESDARATDAAFSAQISAAAGGRRVLAFVGTASTIKGVTLLRDMMAGPDWPGGDILVVVAGRFPDETEPLAREFEALGALVISRFISDAELRALYSGADFVWACYRPDYDQASGIFGRAVQTGRIPVLRAGSLIARFARQNGIAAVELDWASPGKVARPKSPISRIVDQNADFTLSKATISGWKNDFVTTVGAAL